MKKAVTLTLASTLVLGLMAGCTTQNGGQASGAADTSLADATDQPVQSTSSGNFSDEMKIPYAVDLSPEDGADSVERQGDHADSIYFAHPDFYNMESNDTLTILTNFRTIQQSSEWSCGVASVLMVLDWYDQLGDWNEESLAALRHSLDGTELEGDPGTTLVQLLDILDGGGGFTYTSTLDCQDVYSEFTLDTIQSTLAE